MDPELRAVLTALVEGQVQLTQGQAKLSKGLARLAQGQVDLAASHVELENKVSRLTERIDWFGEQVLRGFTSNANRSGELERRVGKLEERVFGPPSPSGRPRRRRAT